MEAVQNKTVHNTKSNSAVSCINETNTDGLSKEKDELLFGAEEDGEDEDALSDDSLRLRLSDDEDAEQEVVTKNHTNVSEFKSPNKDPEKSSKDIITEENSSSDPQQVVEEAVTSDSEKSTPKEPNSAINDPENSTLPSDECTSENKLTENNVHNLENKLTQNNVHNLENSTVVIANGESNEKYTLNINNKKISQDTNNMKNEMQLNHIDDENTVKSEMSDNNSQRENSVIKCIFNSAKDKDKDLNIIEVDNACKKEISEENILENDNLSIDNPTETDSRNVELMNDNEVKLKEAVNECDKIDSATCNSNNLDTSDNKDNKNNKDDKDNKDNKDHLVNSVKLKIDEELSKTTTISDKCDDNLTILSDNVIEKVIVLKHQFTEIDNDHDSIDTIRSYSSDDNSSSFKYSKKCKSKVDSLEHDDDITQDVNIRKMQSIQREMNSELTENKNNSSDIIDVNEIEITNKDHDINKPISKIKDNATSTNLPALVSIIVKDDDSETDDTDTIVQRRKRLKNSKRLNISATQDCIIEEDKQEVTNIGRQRRRTAKNAEEIIRRKYLISDSDISDSDSDSEELSVNYKLNQHLYSASSTSLKRNCPVSDEDVVVNGTVKKVKMGNKSEQTNVKNDFTKLSFVEKFCQRSIKEKIPKLTQEQLEELLIQKIVETITMRSEIGLLREQARISERSQEATRTKLQQLMKQVKDFEMVLNRNAVDRRTNPDKIVTPIKINRSVGLQVNFVTEHGIQNLRQIQQTQQKTPNAPSSVSNPVPEPTNKTNSSPRRGIKIRSPRRPETSVASSTPAVSQSPMQTSPLISTVTPAALVVAKPLDSQQTLTLPNQSSSTIQQLLTGNISQQQIQSQTYVLNGKVQNQTNRPNTLVASKPKNNDLIDLTDEEEKNKSTKITATPVPALIEQQLPTTITTKPVQCFPRVIQTIPTNVSITSQPTNIRVVQPNQPTPTAVVNNGAPSRVTYVMQGSVGATRQLLITSNASQIRPITTCRVTTPFPAVTYKTGTSTIANGTVRVLTTPAVSNIPINIACKHPAPLPDTPSYAINTNWKLPPPAPSLKMSKVPNGIVLSWNMQLTDKYADIASYQLYAYQEVAGVTPSTSLWKKVGDVRALPLPMACTLTQFSEGNNYYFAVRAVDTHSRKGQYSIPGNISL